MRIGGFGAGEAILLPLLSAPSDLPIQLQIVRGKMSHEFLNLG